MQGQIGHATSVLGDKLDDFSKGGDFLAPGTAGISDQQTLC